MAWMAQSVGDLDLGNAKIAVVNMVNEQRSYTVRETPSGRCQTGIARLRARWRGRERRLSALDAGQVLAGARVHADRIAPVDKERDVDL